MTTNQLSVEQQYGLGIQHQQAGRLQEAEAVYRQILAQQPTHGESLHMLGVLAYHAGQYERATELIQQAVTQTLAYPEEAYSNLGSALFSRGRVDEAINAYRLAITHRADRPEIHTNLGNVLRVAGKMGEAIHAYRQAIALKPDYAEAHNHLGSALRATGQMTQAIAAYRQAIAHNPDYPEGHFNLGSALVDLGQLDGALVEFQQVVAVRPDFPEAHNNLGNLLREQGRLQEAIAAYRLAITHNPDYPEAHNNLGGALRELGVVDEAIVACRQAITLKPDYAEPYNNLGILLKQRGQLDEAIAAYRQAIALKQDFPEAYNNLGGALKDQGQLEASIAAYRQAIALKPDYAIAHSGLVFVLHYQSGNDPLTLAEEHRRWNRRHAKRLGPYILPHLNDPNPERRLRIGYVSPDLREHVVGRFVLPLLEHHDKSRVEVLAYAQVAAPDRLTQRLQGYTDQWRSLVGLSDEQAAELIRRDRIDILVDLAGHTAGNRLLVFARKPAPVQLTYLGYPNTSGLTTMDYRLSDVWADPPGQDQAYGSEEVVRLPRCAWCFQPPDEPLARNRPGGTGRVLTFGCFNNFAKVTDQMLGVWGAILRALPNSRLLLKAGGLSSLYACQRVEQVLGAQGIAPERLQLKGWEPTLGDHLELYGQMDIALDTFPYHGTTTTCEALWMGVPVVTLAGKTPVSRVGVSLLSNVGLEELIAHSPQEYVRIAVALANDPTRLAGLATGMRERMQQNPLMDAVGFTRAVEEAYRHLWRRWCERGAVGEGLRAMLMPPVFR